MKSLGCNEDGIPGKYGEADMFKKGVLGVTVNSVKKICYLSCHLLEKKQVIRELNVIFFFIF